MNSFLLIVAIIGCIVLFKQRNDERKQNDVLRTVQKNMEEKIKTLDQEINSLSRFKEVRDAHEFAERLRTMAEEVNEQAQRKAQQIINEAERQADEIRKDANADVKTKREKIDALLESANQQANQIIQDAHKKAEEIAGDAYRAMKEADNLKSVATAMKNIIEGYGDKYLKPTYSLLDELADAYGFDEAGKELKQARERTKLMVEHGRAAGCDYVETNRRETAVNFITDAFNGKVDSILSRTKADNIGTLEQQIKDAYALVNSNGAAFRAAHITHEYLEARLTELKWAVAVHALREREKEEQRRIREQIKEEEKARKEIERAIKESAKEEETLHKAMEKVQAQVAKANDEQRAVFEAKLAELQAKLTEAEERNKRALSMAQQTKAGHVYVISNIGSFGEDVYKVGMTRRLEPLDRIRELGDASVPFSFDVHAMLWSEDAPKLEHDLHKNFLKNQLNKVNPRKEFFRLSLADLRKQVEEKGLACTWTMAAEAAEYRESLAIEAQIKANSPAAQNWLRGQKDYEPSSELITDDETA